MWIFEWHYDIDDQYLWIKCCLHYLAWIYLSNESLTKSGTKCIHVISVHNWIKFAHIKLKLFVYNSSILYVNLTILFLRKTGFTNVWCLYIKSSFIQLKGRNVILFHEINFKHDIGLWRHSLLHFFFLLRLAGILTCKFLINFEAVE